MINYLRKLILLFIRKYIIPKHRFKPSMLVRRVNNTVIYEVEACLYDKELNPVVIMRQYGRDKIFSVTGFELKEFIEHKGIAPSTGTDYL